MNYPRHCTSIILWLCFIAAACHTTTSSLLAGAILRIGTAIIRIATCVTREVHYPLIKIYIFSPLQSVSTVNYDTQKYLLNFHMAHITADDSPKNICLKFYNGSTVDLDMKEIGRRRIPSRDLQNSHFPPAFYYAYDFIDSSETSDCRSNSPIPSLD